MNLVDWVRALAGWNSVVDWLGAWGWETFIRVWPDARVVLSLRDPDDWYDSVRGSIHRWTAPGTDIAPPAVSRVLRQVWDRDFGGWDRVLDRAHATACSNATTITSAAPAPPTV